MTHTRTHTDTDTDTHTQHLACRLAESYANSLLLIDMAKAITWVDATWQQGFEHSPQLEPVQMLLGSASVGQR